MTWIICAILAIVMFWIVFVVDNRLDTSGSDKWQTGHLLLVTLLAFIGGPSTLIISVLLVIALGIYLLVSILTKRGWSIPSILDKDL